MSFENRNETGRFGKEKIFPFPVMLGQAELTADEWVLVIEDNKDQVVIRDVAFFNRDAGAAQVYLAIVSPTSTFSAVGSEDQESVLKLNDTDVPAGGCWREREACISVPVDYALYVMSDQDGNILLTGDQVTT